MVASEHAQTIQRVAIAPSTLARVIDRFERDGAGSAWSWRLGSHGSCEVGPFTVDPQRRVASATGALDGPGRRYSLALRIEITPLDVRACELTLTVTSECSEWLTTDPEAFAAVRRAAASELSEELLFHAARLRRVAV